MAEDTKIIEAVGTAVASNSDRGRDLETAMIRVIGDIQAESEVIWNNPDLAIEDKRAQIAALNDPEAIKQRKLDARASLKAGWSAPPRATE